MGLLPYVNNNLDDEDMNTVNKAIKVINNRGVEILSDAAFLDWLDENGIKHREEVQSFSDLPANDSLNTVRGVADDNKIYIKKENGWVPFQTIDLSKINKVEEKVENIAISILDFGASTDGVTPTDTALKNALNMLSSKGGGKIIYPHNPLGYVLNNVITNASNVEIDFNNQIVKKNDGSGWQLRFEGSKNMKNIKVKNWSGKGDNSLIGGGGLGFALDSENSKITGLLIENCNAEEFGQYGIGIGSASDYVVRDINILNHGSINPSATIGIGFYVYPRTLENKGSITNVYSRINPNSTLTSAAIKLQITENLKVQNIHGVNGTESCISLDAILNADVKGVHIESEYAYSNRRSGLVFGSTNALGIRTNAGFTIDGVTAKGEFLNEIVFASGNPEEVELKNVNIPNGKISATQGSRTESCFVENIIIGEFRTDSYADALFNDVVFNNVEVTKGAFIIKGNRNRAKNITSKNAGTISFVGNNNEIIEPDSESSSTNSILLDGNNNYVIGGSSKNPTGRQVSITGDSNRVIALKTEGPQIVLDNGTNTVVSVIKTENSMTYGPSAPLKGDYLRGAVRINTEPIIGQPVFWVCTESGTPGKWEIGTIMGARRMNNLTDSNSGTVLGVESKLNALLQRLRDSGLML